jgi:hypothetical protein
MTTRSQEAVQVLCQNARTCDKCKTRISPIMVMKHRDIGVSDAEMLRIGERIMIILICATCGDTYGTTLASCIASQSLDMHQHDAKKPKA